MSLIILLISMLSQIALGSIYAWGLFSELLTKNFLFSEFFNSFLFGTILFSLTLAVLFFKHIKQYINLKIINITGSITILLSYFLISLSDGNQIIAVIFAILTGFSIGILYIIPYNICLQTFKSKIVLITGILSACFASGAFFFQFLLNTILKEYNFIFMLRFTGILFFIILISNTFFIKLESDINYSKNKNGEKYTTILYFFMFINCFSTLYYVSNLNEINISIGLDNKLLYAGIPCFAIGNTLGSILWGFIYKKFKKQTIFFNIIINIIFLKMLLFSNGTFILLSAVLCGISLASSFVIYINIIIEFYGDFGLNKIYPKIFAFYGIAALFIPMTVYFKEKFTIDQKGILSFILFLNLTGILVFIKSKRLKHF